MNPQDSWSEIPPYAFWLFGLAAAGWLVGPWLGYRYAQRSKRLGSLRGFRDIVNSLSAGLRAHRNTGLSEAYLDTRPQVRSECSKILEDIRWWKRAGFKRAAARYLALTTQETDPSADPKHMTDAFTVQQRQERFDAARTLIGDCLNDIVRYAH